MRVLYGTTNQAKLHSMKRITEPLGLKLIGLKDLNKPLPFVDETGKNPLENAKIKATAYYQTYGIPVFSCDSGLYFDDLEESLQPETYIRRVNGKELSDEEMIAYYANLAKSHGNHLIGRYRNAIHFIIDENTSFSSMDDSLSTESFMLVAKPHKKRVIGYPLDSLSVDIQTGQYYYDMEEKTVDKSAIDQGFIVFFKECLKNYKV